MNLTISPTTESVAGSDKLVLTYSALNTFRNCPRKYKHRYLDNLRPRERAEALSFGGIVHSAIELWYRSVLFKLPFTLVSDGDKKIVEAYGVWGEKFFMGRHYLGTHRVTFLIGPDGKI